MVGIWVVGFFSSSGSWPVKSNQTATKECEQEKADSDQEMISSPLPFAVISSHRYLQSPQSVIVRAILANDPVTVGSLALEY